METRIQQLAISGVTGFVGGAIAKDLSSTYAIQGLRRNKEDNEVLKYDLGLDSFDCFDYPTRLPNLSGIDTIIHCASSNDVLSKRDDGGMPLSVLGTYSLLRQAVSAGVSTFIFISTAQVYNQELTGDISVASECSPQSDYGLNHLLAEQMCLNFGQRYDLKVHVLRLFNVFGSPSSSLTNRPTLVPECFVLDALRKGEIRLRSSGKQTRCFVHTSQISRTIELLLRNSLKMTVINVGSDWYPTVIDIANTVAKIGNEEFGLKVRVWQDGELPSASNKFQVTDQRIASPSVIDMRRLMDETIYSLFKRHMAM